MVFNCTINPRENFVVRVNNKTSNLTGNFIPLGTTFSFGPVNSNQNGYTLQCETSSTNRLTGILRLNVIPPDTGFITKGTRMYTFLLFMFEG